MFFLNSMKALKLRESTDRLCVLNKNASQEHESCSKRDFYLAADRVSLVTR